VYKYSVFSDKFEIWEREPSRYLEILDPSLYSPGLSHWYNADKGFLVNGHIFKLDANFVGTMSFDKIGDTGVYIGPYPQTEDDIQALSDAGITAVINVQTEIDMKHRGIDITKL